MERDEARALRREGHTLKAIAELAGVSATTVGRWCVGILPARGRGARDTQRHHREAAEAAFERGRWEALELVEDSLWVAGTTMYWGEGDKGQGLGLTNTDAAALRLFMRWVESYHDGRARFAARLHLHDGDSRAISEAHWSSTLGRDLDWGKPFWKGPGTGHRGNIHPHGICKIRVRESGLMLHRTLGWIDGLAIALALARTGTGLRSSPGR